jgi:tetratricopeptide (TPR) repeat protein
VLTGDGARVVQLQPGGLRPAAEVPAPAGLHNLPLRPGPFIGRSGELDRLDAVSRGPGGVVVQALHGLGGVGKSTLASYWAATRADGFAPIWWITADSPSAVQHGLAAFAVALEAELSVLLSPPALAERALQWLTCHTDWLIVLDNVIDPADVAPVLARTASHGRFLITSRLATTWQHVTTVLRLDVLAEDEALDLLTRTVAAPGRDLDGAADLCARLGHLPLAVEQAAAYLAQNPLLTPRAYLDLMDRYPAGMYAHGAVGIEDRRTLARVWRPTLDRIAGSGPTAADVLRVLAWYAPDRIPVTLLEGLADPPALSHAIGLLTAYSMVTADASTGTVSIHRLVQALARTPDPDDPHRTPELIAQARDRATAHLRDLTSGQSAEPDWSVLLPHVEALLDHAPAHTDTATTAELLELTGLFFTGLNWNEIRRSVGFFRRALATLERLFGPGHPATLTARDRLADAYVRTRDTEQAVSLWEDALATLERLLGPGHPTTLTTREHLADAQCRAGGTGGAISREQALAALESMLGPDRPGTLTAGDHLALAYFRTEETGFREGDMRRAVPVWEQAAAALERLLGPDHPTTLSTRHRLALAYSRAGDRGKAIPVYEQTVAAMERVLGADHPSTLTARLHLNTAYGNAHEPGTRAVSRLEQALADSERRHGPHGLLGRPSRNRLIRAYRAAGDFGRAIPLLEREIAISKAQQEHGWIDTEGDDIPGYCIELARAHREAGDPRRAIRILVQELAELTYLPGLGHAHDSDAVPAFRRLLDRALHEHDEEEAGRLADRAVAMLGAGLDRRWRPLPRDDGRR